MGETILKKPAERLVALLVAFVLVVTMIPVVPAIAYADSEELDGAEESCVEEIADELCDGDVDEEFYEEVVDDLEDLESVGLESEYVTGVEKTDEGMTYEMEFPEGTEADVTIIDDDEECLSLQVEEDGNSSTLTFGDDGSIFLDGVLLDIEVAEEEMGEDAQIQQSSDYGSYYTSKNPRPGKSWKWFASRSGVTKLENKVVSYGTTAISLIYSALASKVAGIHLSVALTVAQVAIDANKFSHYLSVKSVIYKPYYNGKVYTRVKLKDLGTRRVEKTIFCYYSVPKCKGAPAATRTRYLIGD